MSKKVSKTRIILLGFFMVSLVFQWTYLTEISQAKEKIIIALGAEPRTGLSNTVVDWTTHAQLRHMYDPVIARDRKTGAMVPALAVSWKSLDNLTWEFKLRKGVTFHNGEPFNAESFKFSMDYILDDANKSTWKPRYSRVDRTEIVDDYTVRVHTKKPFPTLLEVMDLFFKPLPPEYLKEKGVQYAAEHPVGTGAYKFVEWVKEERLVLEKNPDYWQGEPEIDQVEFRFIPEFSTRLSALLANEIDVIKDVPTFAVEVINKSQKASIRSTVSSRLNYISLVNTKEGPMQDVRVRKAMNYAVNVPLLIKTVLNGNATQMAGPLGPLNSGFNPNIKPYGYDPEKAKALIKEAGYDLDKLELTLESPSGRYPMDKSVAQAIAAQLGQAGIKVKVQVNEWGTHLDRIINRQTGDMFLLGWGPSLDPQTTLQPLFLPDMPYSGFGDPEITKKMNETVVLVDEAARKKGFDEIQEMAWEKAGWIFLWLQHDLYGVASWVDWTPRPDEELWMFEAKNAK